MTKKIYSTFLIACIGISMTIAQTTSQRLVLAEEHSGAW
jgi:hypothetical protein